MEVVEVPELTIEELTAAIKAKKRENKATAKEKTRRQQKKKQEIRSENVLQSVINMTSRGGGKCGVKLSTIPHVNTCFASELCDFECPVFSTCRHLLSLANKGILRRAGGGTHSKLADVTILKAYTPGKATFTVGGKSFAVNYTDWTNYKTAKRVIFTRELIDELGLTVGQIQGLEHWPGMHKKLGLTEK